MIHILHSQTETVFVRTDNVVLCHCTCKEDSFPLLTLLSHDTQIALG